MIPTLFNIKDAMATKRPTDKILAILDNRFCLAYSQYTDLTYCKYISIHFLLNDTVYTLTHLEAFKKALFFEQNKYKGSISLGFVQNFANQYHIKIIDCRKSNQRYRQLERALKLYVEQNLPNSNIIKNFI